MRPVILCAQNGVGGQPMRSCGRKTWAWRAFVACIMDTHVQTYIGGPKQLEYANVIDPKINLDLHLLLDGVGGAR